MSYETKLTELKEQLENTTDFILRSEIEGEIEDIQVRMGDKLPPKPIASDYECVGCSA